MEYDTGDYPTNALQEKAAGALGAALRNPPLRKRMELQKAELQKRIEYIDSALKILDANPGIEQFQDLMGKLGHI